MFGIYKKGFTLIELIVVIMLIGLVATIVIPNLKLFRPGYERKVFVENLNVIVQSAWYAALATHTTQKLVFDFKNRMITIESEQSVNAEQDSMKKLPSSFNKRVLEWPKTLQFQQFFIDGKNDIGQPGRTVTKIWFYLVPDGASQEIILNMTDSSVGENEQPKKFSLVLNPFIARFKEYDNFQNP